MAEDQSQPQPSGSASSPGVGFTGAESDARATASAAPSAPTPPPAGAEAAPADETLSPDEFQALLAGAALADASAPASAASPPTAAQAASAARVPAADPRAAATTNPAVATRLLTSDVLPEFATATEADANGGDSLDLLLDVNLRVKIELGRTRMLVEDVLRLGEGSVVELDRLAGDPVDIYANDRLIARGEILVLNDNFCVRVSEVVTLDPHRVGAA